MTIDERWNDAIQVWLASKARRSEHTARAYQYALTKFRSFVEPKLLHEIGGAEAQAWANHLHGLELADSTLNARLAACSSFWSFCIRRYTFVENGRERPLAIFNPFDQVDRQRVEMYGQSRPLSLEQARALLAGIDRGTVIGARDYALIYFMLMTGRRNSEARRLRWGDVLCRADGTWRYHWRGKGKARWDDLPLPVLEVIRLYLWRAGRQGLGAVDFVFCAEKGPGSQALSDRHVNRIVQGHLRRAGVDWGSAHTLRHTAVALADAAGDDVQRISSMLAHSTLAVTQVYLSATRGHRDESWQRRAEMLSSSHSNTKRHTENSKPTKEDSCFAAGSKPGLPGGEVENAGGKPGLPGGEVENAGWAGGLDGGDV